MNKIILTALVPFAVLSPLASASASVPAATATSATIVAGSGTSLTYNELYTESNWQRVQLSPEVLSRLGRLTGLQLHVAGLPGNVSVAISSKSGPVGTVGLNITRTDKTIGVHQTGTFTLTSPATGESYTFRATVTGSGR
jgi:opacity protein-like surface antigen